MTICCYTLLSFTACNCSELSISEECDAVTGQCQCQEGAIGIKCDDCAFGYFGELTKSQYNMLFFGFIFHTCALCKLLIHLLYCLI